MLQQAEALQTLRDPLRQARNPLRRIRPHRRSHDLDALNVDSTMRLGQRQRPVRRIRALAAKAQPAIGRWLLGNRTAPRGNGMTGVAFDLDGDGRSELLTIYPHS